MSLRAWYFHRSASLIVRSRTAEKIVDGALEEVDGRSFEELSQERDALILGLLELISRRGKAEMGAARRDTVA